jgi:hypothetical protein
MGYVVIDALDATRTEHTARCILVRNRFPERGNTREDQRRRI